VSKLIKLTGRHAVGDRQYAIVDDEVFEYLSQWKWKTTPPKDGGHGYAVRNTRRGGKNGTLYMHRVVIGETGGLPVDHINHDSLDNRRANLRAVTVAENTANRKPEEQRGVCSECSRSYVRIGLSGGAHKRRYCSDDCLAASLRRKSRERALRRRLGSSAEEGDASNAKPVIALVAAPGIGCQFGCTSVLRLHGSNRH